MNVPLERFYHMAHMLAWDCLQGRVRRKHFPESKDGDVMPPEAIEIYRRALLPWAMVKVMQRLHKRGLKIEEPT